MVVVVDQVDDLDEFGDILELGGRLDADVLTDLVDGPLVLEFGVV